MFFFYFELFPKYLQKVYYERVNDRMEKSYIHLLYKKTIQSQYSQHQIIQSLEYLFRGMQIFLKPIICREICLMRGL